MTVTAPARTSGYVVDVARTGDDAALRAVLRATPVPGAVSLTYEREPSFFAADAVLGERVETLVAREAAMGAVVGLGYRALRRVWVGGEVRRTAYLGGLRVLPAHRDGRAHAAAWRAMRERHEAAPADLTLTSITAENGRARRLLAERPRGAAPAFRPVADVVTLALPVWRWRRVPDLPPEPDPPLSGRSLRPQAGKRFALPRAGLVSSHRPSPLVILSASEGSRHGPPSPPAPVPTARDDGVEILHSVGCADLAVQDDTLGEGSRPDLFPAALDGADLPGAPVPLVVRQNGEAVASAVLWDAAPVRQSVVRAYGPGLRRARPVLNAVARVVGAPSLPRPGERLRSAFLVLAQAKDAGAFGRLLDAALGAARARGLAFVLVGLDTLDPRLAVARRRLHVAYRSTLYAADWGDGRTLPISRPVHVEPATL